MFFKCSNLELARETQRDTFYFALEVSRKCVAPKTLSQAD